MPIPAALAAYGPKEAKLDAGELVITFERAAQAGGGNSDGRTQAKARETL
jgi:hypothetical protein